MLFVKAGFAFIDQDEQVVDGASPSEDTTNTFYGIGVNVEFSNGLIVRGLYEEYGKDDGQTDVTGAKADQIDPDVMSLSLIKRF